MPPSPPIVHEEYDSDDWESESDGERSQDATGIAIPQLLPVPATLAKPGDSLCDTCKALKLSAKRFVVSPSDNLKANKPDDPNMRLGLVIDIQKKTHCPFCRLVLKALGPNLPTIVDGKPVEVTMSWNTEGPIPDPNQPWHHIPQIRVLRPYAQKKGGGYFGGPNMLNMFPEITLLANDAPTPSKTFFVRLINNRIDFAMVRNWLTMCETWHGGHCTSKAEMLDKDLNDPATEIPSFRVIDVVDNCIIPAPSKCKYAVLSYVWGKIDPDTILRNLKNIVNELEKPGVLVSQENYDRIPKTIRDAMWVTRELGLRYLWVDSLCIVQDDNEQGGSKMQAIAKMGLVYGAAYITIIAGTGTDANAGLPGVHADSRGVDQAAEQLLPGLRLGFKPKWQDHIPGATYFTRAWTFQEQQFSRRSLVFIGGQVVFRCMQTDQWREDVVFEERRSRYGSTARSARDVDDIGKYEGLLQSYSGLSITFESDIYHAFAGMIRFIQRELKANLVHGLADAYFDWSLLWTALAPQERRKCAPSWSWSGWKGESWPHMWDWYSRSIARIRKAQRKRTWIIWYQRKAHDSEEYIRDRFPFDCTQTLPTPRKLVGVPAYIEDTYNPTPGSGFLQFWTVSVAFKVGKSVSKETKRGPENTHIRAGIFGRDGREVGIAFVHPDWFKANISKSHEFILLCEGRDVRAEDGRMDDEPGWKYKMMLIEWHGEWAERVSLGSIEKHDLTQALAPGPVWKEIILG
ncbi:hypothetical protein NLJ89_g6119 [Agrocybe chaxingu]|uniref:Heterokaryon incompatibility domain-containing protein n=1 Tax=Agrocybe chaxingu TaxID=84603 RepID=A0A9W8JZR9_9AGAR|nr:hypothetical protein NLJ89_g6119 [Agrocybe chaxingu]